MPPGWRRWYCCLAACLVTPSCVAICGQQMPLLTAESMSIASCASASSRSRRTNLIRSSSCASGSWLTRLAAVGSGTVARRTGCAFLALRAALCLDWLTQPGCVAAPTLPPSGVPCPPTCRCDLGHIESGGGPKQWTVAVACGRWRTTTVAEWRSGCACIALPLAAHWWAERRDTPKTPT